MRRRSMPPAHGSEVNVTPLIDVVMCLIVFFMLVAKIGVVSGVDPKIKIPESILGKTIEELGNNIVLNVRAPEESGDQELPVITVMQEGNALAEMPIVQRSNGQNVLVDGKPVKPLYMMVKESLTSNKQKGQDLTITIHADTSLQYKYLEQVLTECNAAGCTTMNFETTRKLND